MVPLHVLLATPEFMLLVISAGRSSCPKGLERGRHKARSGRS